MTTRNEEIKAAIKAAGVYHYGSSGGARDQRELSLEPVTSAAFRSSKKVHC